MHCWSWTFFQICQKSTILKTPIFDKRAQFFPLDSVLSCHTRVTSLISWLNIYFSILFHFYWFNSLLINIKSNKIQKIDVKGSLWFVQLENIMWNSIQFVPSQNMHKISNLAYFGKLFNGDKMKSQNLECTWIKAQFLT